jgi:prepilin-type N-terminal cleavage/methylation domain-containing protein
MKTSKGFTLIELMIVVAILGILAAVAVPMYTDYITRSQLVEAHTGLSGFRVSMEQYYQDNRNYGVGACGAAAPAYTRFTHACVLNNAGQGYTATATGNATERVNGFVFTINETNQRQTTATAAGWAPATMPAACFVTRKGSC